MANVKWRKLDNSAKLFPILSNKKFSTVFRLSVVLKEQVQPDILLLALSNTLNKYSSYKVKLKKGFFWYYLEFNPKEPIIEVEKNYPCKYIDQDENNGYLLKVTYFEKKINMDVFHSLTDGNSATDFFRELIYNYIELAHPEESDFKTRGEKRIVENNTEDSYLKNYNKKLPGNASAKKAYLLNGKRLPLDAIGVIHGFLNLTTLKQICKEKNVTITQYLTAVLMKAIYDSKYEKKQVKKPIKICIPVNLKKYFASTTLTNFFSYITVEADCYRGKLQSFEDMLTFVKHDFEMKLTEEEITKTMSANVRLGNHILIRLIPLFLKVFTVKMSYMEIRKYTTTTFSNIGRIGILPEYRKYIDTFLFLLAPEQVERIKCSACSYEDEMIFTFTSILADVEVQKRFFDILKEQGVSVKIESNGVQDVIS